MLSTTRTGLFRLFVSVFTAASLALAAGASYAAPQSSQNSVQKSARKAPQKKAVPKASARTAAKKAPSSKKAQADASKESLAQASRQKETITKEREELAKKLDSLKDELEKTQATHQKTSSELAKSEVSISQANKRLRELSSERSQIEKRLRQLKDEERSVTGEMTNAEHEIRNIARAQYVTAHRSPWQSVIAGKNPHEIARDQASLIYFARAGHTELADLTTKKHTIESISEETASKRRDLNRVLAREKEDRQDLLKAQAERKKTLGELSRQMTAQKADIERIEKDQARLDELSARIEKIIAERERELKKRELAAQKSPGKETAAYVPQGSFAKKKGHLVMPALGKVTGRFGQNRENLSGVSTKWKGILIEAKEGSDVLACEAGTVIFSDWVQGWGNTMYIDHGNGFLSVYAYNESLYKKANDRVRRGETIASVGNTGGRVGKSPALYFELRHASKPLNPLQWIGK